MALPLPDFLPFVLHQLRVALGAGLHVSARADNSRLSVEADEFRITELLPGGRLTVESLLMAPRIPRSITLAPYIPAKVAERLRNQGQYYADAMGNAWLEVPSAPTSLYVTGMRSRKLHTATGAAFQLQGLRLLFHLLATPELLHCADRELARNTAIQRSVIAEVLENLAQQGFLEQWSGSRRLVNQPALAARWLAGYSSLLRVRLPTQRYQWATASRTHSPWPVVARRTRSLLGGAVAARQLLAGAFVSPTVTLYNRHPHDFALLQSAGLEPHPNGPVEVVYLFARPEASPLTGCVHPLLVYADLVLAGDPESRATAEKIRARYLPHLAA